MFDNKWLSGLAFGLVTSLFLVILASVSLSEGPPNWWHHTGTVVASEDTLAQWLMMIWSLLAVIVSGLAVYWVKRTFDVTQNMALDTRRIGEAQVRAYLDVQLSKVQAGQNGKSLWTFRVSLSNTGQSPASQIFVQVRVAAWGSFDTTFPDLGAGGQFEGGIPVTGLGDDAFTRTPKRFLDFPKVCVTVRFLDVFHETSPERFECRYFQVERVGEGSEDFRIRFVADHDRILERMKKDPKFSEE